MDLSSINNSKKIKYAILLIIIGYLFYLYGPQWYKYPNTDEVIRDPIQVSVEKESFEQEFKGETYTIKPKATYDIKASIKSKHRYYFDSASGVSNIDFTAVWGGLHTKEANRHLKYYQFNRYSYYWWYEDSGVDSNYFFNHVSNIHIIAADADISKQLNKIKTGDFVHLTGYLVSVTNPEGYKILDSSMTRYDSGGGACEVLYVETVRILDPDKSINEQ